VNAIAMAAIAITTNLSIDPAFVITFIPPFQSVFSSCKKRSMASAPLRFTGLRQCKVMPCRFHGFSWFMVPPGHFRDRVSSGPMPRLDANSTPAPGDQTSWWFFKSDTSKRQRAINTAPPDTASPGAITKKADEQHFASDCWSWISSRRTLPQPTFCMQSELEIIFCDFCPPGPGAGDRIIPGSPVEVIPFISKAGRDPRRAG
jgi:hypothetical protein